MWPEGVGVGAAVRLEADEWRGSDRPVGSPSLGELVSGCAVIGTNDVLVRFTICVKSSLFVSCAPGALAERPIGSDSWRGLSKDDKRKTEGPLATLSVKGVVGTCSPVRAIEERPAVVSTTVGEHGEDRIPLYERTDSRICSSAVGRSWKYAKK